MIIKDTEWLKAEVNKALRNKVADGINYYDYMDLGRTLNELISQLDNPEALSQEWIDNNSINASSDGITEEYVHVIDLQNLIIPKQDLPVIPQNVADWITKYRDILDLYPALRRLEDNPLTWKRVYEWYRMNTHQFVNAYLTGKYEVGEEQKYYALVKGHELIVDADDNKYWNCDVSDGDVFPSNRYSQNGRYLTKLSQSEWDKFGINDSNADFVKVDDMEKYEEGY